MKTTGDEDSMMPPKPPTARPRRVGAGTKGGNPASGLPDLRGFDLIGTGIFGLDLGDGGRIVAAGEAGIALLGDQNATPIGRLPAEVFPPPVARLIAEAPPSRAPIPRSVETQMPSPESPDRTIEWTLHVLDDTRLALLESADITPRKRADIHLRNLSRAVEQSPASVLITDVKGPIE
jgi:hypothetical protein